MKKIIFVLNKPHIMNKIVAIFIVLSFPFLALGQKRIAIDGIDFLKKEKKGFFSALTDSKSVLDSRVINEVPKICANFFVNEKKFTAIDRQNLTIVNAEKELQKSEEFIDGYMVEQGRSEGVDLLLKPFYFSDTKMLNIRIYDIEDGTVKCMEETKLKTGLWGPKQMEKRVVYMLHDLMFSCFDKKFKVMRVSKGNKKKAKRLLVAVGKKNIVEKGDPLEIFYMEEEEVDGEKLQRKEVIGYGEIKEIEDKNFSQVDVKKGRDRVAEALEKGKKVYCKINNEFED